MAESVVDTVTIANNEYDLYKQARDTGHLTYMRRARLCEDFYLGGGRQWRVEDRIKNEDEGRPLVEQNEVLATVQAILGYQIDNRVDPQLLPARGPVDEEDASRLTKLVKHVFRENQFDWVESQVFADGLIQQRGYYDIRMKFDDNLKGEIVITDEDPLDIIPDQYGNSYDPESWKQVQKTTWMTYDEIADLYGDAAAEQTKNLQIHHDLGDEDGIIRNNFMNSGAVETETNYDEAGNRSITSFQFTGSDVADPDRVLESARRVRVIERQFKRRVKTKFFVDSTTGDMRMVPDNFTKEQIENVIAKTGGEVFIYTKYAERVRWRVVAGNVLLHDEWSPYNCYTIVPYFAYFRRGKTIGAVDNLISQQEMLNKMLTNALHIANTTSNSGWVVEEDSLVDMEKEDLEEEGAKSGLVVVYARGSEPPQKIKPNPVPGAIERLIERAHIGIQTVSAIDASAKGMKDGNESGIAGQTRQAQHSLQVCGPLDNLSRTRYMVVKKVVDLLQYYYTDERQLNIVGHDPVTGKEKTEQLTINGTDQYGNTFNDMTKGEFSVVIHTAPSQSTVEGTQQTQLLAFLTAGLPIPPDEVIRRSNLQDRTQLADRMREQATPSPEQQSFEQQMREREIRSLDAEIRVNLEKASKLRAEAARARSTAVTGAIENAATLSLAPQLGGLADGVQRVNEGA